MLVDSESAYPKSVTCRAVLFSELFVLERSASVSSQARMWVCVEAGLLHAKKKIAVREGPCFTLQESTWTAAPASAWIYAPPHLSSPIEQLSPTGPAQGCPVLEDFGRPFSSVSWDHKSLIPITHRKFVAGPRSLLWFICEHFHRPEARCYLLTGPVPLLLSV